MPYPPPPGPPDVGEFQAIGKLPAPQLPDVTGHGGEFLETDGIIPQWEPVSGVLPDQTGHAGEFLTTDGAIASWAPAGGGLPSQTGNADKFLTTDGVNASWGFNWPNPYDVRNFGAVPNDPTNDFALAYYACLAAQPNAVNGGPIYVIASAAKPCEMYIPPGTYYTSMPLVGAGPRVGEADIGGAGRALTIIVPGIGTGSDANVPSFSGPVMYVNSCYTPTQLVTAPYDINIPVYTTPLVGATGQSFVLTESIADGPNRCLRLHDSFPWGSWLGDFAYPITNFGLQFWVRVDGPASGWAGGLKGIIGSRGPAVWLNRAPNPSADIAFGIYAVSDGANVKLRAYLTTNPAWNSLIEMQSSGTLYSIDSANITLGTPIHVELDYDGAFIDFYVDGVNQGHVAATGPIIRNPWEGVGIGAQGPEILEKPQAVPSIEGAIDSVRLSNVTRHTGIGGFTPPVAKYTWDANTYALYNFDQAMKTIAYGASTITLPFVVGQVVTQVEQVPAGQLAGPLPHYIRLTGPVVAPDMLLHDFAVSGNRSCSGIVNAYADRNAYARLWVTCCSQFGIAVLTGVSFYDVISDVDVFDVVGTGVQYFGEMLGSNNMVQCGIAVGISNGRMMSCNYQPTFQSFAGLVLYDGSFTTEIAYFSLDDEVYPFGRQIGGGVSIGSALDVFFHNNFWGTAGGVSPTFNYLNLTIGSNVTHQNDTFSPDQYNTSVLCSGPKWSGAGLPLANISLINCYIHDNARTTKLPISNVDGWVSVRTAAAQSNQVGLSISDVQAKNLAGTFTISGGFTTGGPRFVIPEPDANYDVIITPKSSLGGAPAAGSNRIASYDTRTDGFTATLEAAPGGIVENTYSWMMVRTQPPPLYFDYLPAIPSSFTNPLDTVDPNLAFAVGFTMVPVTGDALGWDNATQQTIIEAGTTVETGSWWEVGIEGSNALMRVSIGTFIVDLDGRVDRGQYFNIHNPGVNNFVLVYPGPASAPTAFFNGVGPIPIAGVITLAGIQQTPVHVGERYDASMSLTGITLKNLKMDTHGARCISDDSAIGPGVQPQAALFGDNYVMGFRSTVPIGGFGTQIAQARYGSTYYWLGGRALGSALTGPSGAYETVFKPWLGASTAPSLNSFCLFPGNADIVAGATATDVFATLTKLLEGEKASATFTPPNSFTSPSDLRALAISRMPVSGTASYTINGRAFSVPFISDSNATVNNFISLINADGPTAALFTPSNIHDPNSGLQVLLLQVKLPGTQGNGYVCATNGTGGSFWYGDIGGGVPGQGASVKTFAGSDTTCIINGVVFPANFDTDANTTVNNLIARIAANPTIDALVACSLVGGKMFCEAKAAGWLGSTISIGGNGSDTPIVGNPWDQVGFLAGGSNGAITSGIPNILFCTCPAMKGSFGVTPTMITELNSLNTLINAYVGAGVTVVDVNALTWDPGDHDALSPALSTGGLLNDAGHVAVFNILAPLLPGVGTPPSALSYATNPASYASGAPIATNSPTVTGSVVRWTVSPPLPAGLSISSTTGDITGTPTTPTAAADYTVGATNTAGTITVLVNITIT